MSSGFLVLSTLGTLKECSQRGIVTVDVIEEQDSPGFIRNSRSIDDEYADRLRQIDPQRA